MHVEAVRSLLDIYPGQIKPRSRRQCLPCAGDSIPKAHLDGASRWVDPPIYYLINGSIMKAPI